MKPLYATQHEARLIASLPEGGTGMFCREAVDIPVDCDHSPWLDRPDYEPGFVPHPNPDGTVKCKWCMNGQRLAKLTKRNQGVTGIKCPYPIGAVLAVKEAHQFVESDDVRNPWRVYPDGTCWRIGWESRVSSFQAPAKWRPGAMMPKTAVRSYIRITGLRVARVQDVTEEEARLMGYAGNPTDIPDEMYSGMTAKRRLEGRYHKNGKPAQPGWKDIYQWLYTFEKVNRDSAHA